MKKVQVKSDKYGRLQRGIEEVEYILFHIRSNTRYVDDRFNIIFIDGYGVVMMYLGDKVKIKEDYRKNMMCAGRSIPREVGAIGQQYVFTIGPVEMSGENLPVTQRELVKGYMQHLKQVFQEHGYLDGLGPDTEIVMKEDKSGEEEWLVGDESTKFILEYDKIEGGRYERMKEAIYVSTIEWDDEYVVNYFSPNKGVESRIYIHKNGLRQIKGG